jgi:peptidoglycan biosynthesis protein MviN/MurJ (putative lipid II flippase)
VGAFYAREDTWRPMWLGTALALPAAWLYFELGRRHGAAGLAVAGVLGMSLTALATLVYARRLHGAPALRALCDTLARAALCALLAGAAASLVPARDSGPAAAAVQLALGGMLFAAVGLGAGWWLGDAALRGVILRLLRRLRRGR